MLELAELTKESITAAKQELIGLTTAEARTWAADETAAQERLCEALAEIDSSDLSDLAVAERELARVHSR